MTAPGRRCSTRTGGLRGTARRCDLESNVVVHPASLTEGVVVRAFDREIRWRFPVSSTGCTGETLTGASGVLTVPYSDAASVFTGAGFVTASMTTGYESIAGTSAYACRECPTPSPQTLSSSCRHGGGDQAKAVVMARVLSASRFLAMQDPRSTCL